MPKAIINVESIGGGKMIKTNLPLCDSSWSPVTGCLNDCEYCYARGLANRFKGCNLAPNGETTEKVITLPTRLKVTNKDGITRNAAYPYGFTPTLHEYRLNDPKTKGFGKTVFVCSMADLFGEWIPDEWIEKVFASCAETENHRYLFLTKNPARYMELAEKGKLPTGNSYWYGTTTTTPSEPWFYSDQHNTFVSVEPIHGYFDGIDDVCKKTDWIILGAETGNRKNKIVPHRNWVEGLVNSCNANGIPVFMKDSMIPIWGENILTELPWDDKEE